MLCCRYKTSKANEKNGTNELCNKISEEFKILLNVQNSDFCNTYSTLCKIDIVSTFIASFNVTNSFFNNLLGSVYYKLQKAIVVASILCYKMLYL